MSNLIGRVVNQKNAPVDGAKVSLTFQGIIRTDYTDSEGKYRFSVVFPSSESFNSDIKVERDGYKIYYRLIEISSTNSSIEEFRLTSNDITSPSEQITVTKISRQALIIAASIGLTGTLITLLFSYFNNKSTDYEDGTFLRGVGSSPVYIMEANHRRWIQYAETLNCMVPPTSSTPIQDIPLADLKRIPQGQNFSLRRDGARNGALVKKVEALYNIKISPRCMEKF